MTERTRKHPVQFYLNDEEEYILEKKFQLSKMKSKSAFLRKLVLYGFVYDVDYSHIRNMNALLGNIGGNLNQIAKRVNTTNTIYKRDMEDIKELMNQIWQLQKSMVSKQPLIKQ
ncbi:MAG: plasmid mobilization relaxosome protein MobC [Hespellia sp.]|nr:plasmid mobilization relaxosome protein MobC [Hespellia sp.]